MGIRQLTADDLKMIEGLCRPFEFEGSVTLRKDLMLSLLNEVHYNRSRSQAGTLEIRSLVSMKDRKPYVSLTFGNTFIQLSVQDTLDHAKRLIEVACGAAADGFLANFAEEKMHITAPETIGPLLQEFRDYRDQKLGMLQPDDLPPPDDKDV